MSSIKYKDPSTGEWLTIVNIDTTLSQNGQAADAGAVGVALNNTIRFDQAQNLTDEQKAQARENIGTGVGGGTLDLDTTLMESGLAADSKATGDAIKNSIVVSESEPESELTRAWVNIGGETIQVPQINDEEENNYDTWSSAKIKEYVNSGLTGTRTNLASGTIPSGTVKQTAIDTGLSYDEFLRHHFIKLTMTSTESNNPEYTFRDAPSAQWHYNAVGTGTSNTGHYHIFESNGVLLRDAMVYSSPYSTLGGDGFSIVNYNVDPQNAKFNYSSWNEYAGELTMKLTLTADTTADWTWSIWALD